MVVTEDDQSEQGGLPIERFGGNCTVLEAQITARKFAKIALHSTKIIH